MNPGIYRNGFVPGETVRIDMPRGSYDGLETEVVRPRPVDVLGPEDVLVRNPLDRAWVLRLPKDFLVKTGACGWSAGQPQAYAPAPAGLVLR